ncbi:MFS transporter [Microbacterium halotolerans]|uniref:MFS transporter n=1 Tax=Microbacterium halotolerans TaxID=246613 RepID=UPI000E6AD571|nr:MFS transporter [Microbacterium halotolerans]
MTSLTAPTRPLTRSGLAVLLVAFVPVNFTFGSVNVLADDIGRDLGTGSAGEQLVLSAYTAAFAASLVIAGRLGDRCGRRRMLIVGGLGVAVLSIAAAFVTSLVALVALRVLLGVAAGLLTPQVLSTIQTTAEGPTRRTGLMLFAAMSGVSTVLGQVVAGGIAAAAPADLGWRIVQVVTGAIALVGVVGLRAVPESRSPEPLAMDVRGAVTIGASLLLVIVPLTIGPGEGWPAWSIVAIFVGMTALLAFWQLQRRSERQGVTPVVPPSVLRIRVVRRGLVMTLLFFATYGAFLYELSALAQARFGMGALGASLLVLGFGAAFVATSVILPVLLPTAGSRTMMFAALGQAATFAGVGILAFSGRDDLWSLQFVLIPLGVAQAMMFGPLLHTVLSRAPHWAAGAASGLFTTMQQVGLSVGVALLGGAFWQIAGDDSAAIDTALGAVFAVHALCALAFAALARTLDRRPQPAV